MITHDQRKDIIDEFLKTYCFPVMLAKGRDYAGTDHQADVNANFKRAGERWGIGTLQAWGVYFGKHIDAIETFIRTDGAAQSEPILGRITDAVNYLFILLALLEDVELVPYQKSGIGIDINQPTSVEADPNEEA